MIEHHGVFDELHRLAVVVDHDHRTDAVQQRRTFGKVLLMRIGHEQQRSLTRRQQRLFRGNEGVGIASLLEDLHQRQRQRGGSVDHDLRLLP